MSALVIDTSVLIKWLCPVGEKYLAEAERVYQDFADGNISIYVPELVKYEVGNVLVYGKKLTESDYAIAQEIFSTLPLDFVSETPELASLTHHLAVSSSISYYDASFVALAQYYSVKLLTEDGQLCKKTPQLGVIRLQDYSTIAY